MGTISNYGVCYTLVAPARATPCSNAVNYWQNFKVLVACWQSHSFLLTWEKTERVFSLVLSACLASLFYCLRRISNSIFANIKIVCSKRAGRSIMKKFRTTFYQHQRKGKRRFTSCSKSHDEMIKSFRKLKEYDNCERDSQAASTFKDSEPGFWWIKESI